MESPDAVVMITSLSEDSEVGCGADEGGGVGVGNVLGAGPDWGGSLLETLLLLVEWWWWWWDIRGPAGW